MPPRAQVQIEAAGRALDIEYACIGAADAPGPLLVFLHEGLGSITQWRGFPEQLCATLNARGLLYARPGYGHSTPRPAHETWPPDYLHQQALVVLPALLAALGERGPIALVGHSDGASIALLHAAHHAVAWTVAMAPHIDVEAKALAGIRVAKAAFEQGTALRRRLSRHHADVNSAFYGWANAWLSPAFAGWSIAREIEGIRAPLLAIQGVDDEYATLDQIRRIAGHVPQVQLLELPHCGHTPFADQPAAVLGGITAWLAQNDKAGL